MRIKIPLVSSNENAGALRVAVVPRLVPAFSFGLAVAGAGISALRVKQTLLAMRYAETAGIDVVARRLAEANIPVLVALYLAIVGGAVGLLVLVIRMFVNTTTSSPPVWFILLAGALGILPVSLFSWAQSLMIEALFPGSGGIMSAANILSFLLPAIMIGAPFIILLLLAISVWPMRSLSKPKWGPLAVLLMVELELIVMAVGFQIRASWLFEVSQTEQLMPG
jgi:hypothetical protein